MTTRYLLLTLVLSVFAGAYVLPLVESLDRIWVWLVTWPAPPSIRDRIREERRAHVCDERVADQVTGYRPIETAAHLLVGWLVGIPADLALCGCWLWGSVRDRALIWALFIWAAVAWMNIKLRGRTIVANKASSTPTNYLVVLFFFMMLIWLVTVNGQEETTS